MIKLIEALNFRCLRYIRQQLGPFHVLVGPNASGKTTFLDVVAFLGRLVSDGLEAAISERTQNFRDLIWGREGRSFELAIELSIPGELRDKLPNKEVDTIRYEIAFCIDDGNDEYIINIEKVLLIKAHGVVSRHQRELFPYWDGNPPQTIITPPRVRKPDKLVINKVPGGKDNFYPEVHPESSKGWIPSFKLGPHKSALGNLPADESKFPVSTWLKKFMNEGVQQFILNSLSMREASPPGRGRGFRTDGSNLPWVIENLQKNHQENFQDWLNHLQTALPDLENIRTIERPEDKHRYLMLCYKRGLEVPSWMASDGTLRLLALTLPAYMPALSGVYLIEEPENGIHPRAVETAYQSLSSVYNAQILLATHSAIILSMVEPDQVLCFAKTPGGETDIIRGSDHPNLKEWKGETNLGVLFAGGVLG